MEDEKLLAKLYDLRQTLKEYGTCDGIIYLDKWIDETKYDIADASGRFIGCVNGVKAIRNLLKVASKKDERFGKILKSSKRFIHVATDGEEFAIVFNGDFGLPTTARAVDVADTFALKALSLTKDSGRKPLHSPTPSEIDTVIKFNAPAETKKERNRVLYDFGVGCPKVRASHLFMMRSVFLSPTVYYIPDLADDSPVLFKWDGMLGLLLPPTDV